VAVTGRVPPTLDGWLGIAMAKRTYKAYRDLLASDRWLRLVNFGARSQRLLWASTGTKDPKASDIVYVKSLAAPHSVNTMPEKTLLALAAELQREGAAAFVKSWEDLLACIEDKSAALRKAGGG